MAYQMPPHQSYGSPWEETRIRLPPLQALVSGTRPIPSDPHLHSRLALRAPANSAKPLHEFNNAAAMSRVENVYDASLQQQQNQSQMHQSQPTYRSSASSSTTSPTLRNIDLDQGQSAHCRNETRRRAEERCIRVTGEVAHCIFPSWDISATKGVLTAANNRCGQQHKSLDIYKRMLMNQIVLMRVLKFIFGSGPGAIDALVNDLERWDPEQEVVALGSIDLISTSKAEVMAASFEDLKHSIWPESDLPAYKTIQKQVLDRLYVVDDLLKRNFHQSEEPLPPQSRVRQDSNSTDWHRPVKRNRAAGKSSSESRAGPSRSSIPRSKPASQSGGSPISSPGSTSRL